MSKCCNQCKETKPLTDFSPQKGTRDGVMTRCKTCRRSASKIAYASDVDRQRERSRNIRKECPEAIARSRKKWADANPDNARKRQSDWYHRNPEHAIAIMIRWREANPEKYKESRKRIHAKASQKASFRISNAMRARVYETLKGNKSGATFAILGYTCADLMRHIEAQFLPGMTWENYGPVWHVDHIKPLASFSFETINDDGFKQAWALTNLQPLWAVENIRKGARLDYQRAA